MIYEKLDFKCDKCKFADYIGGIRLGMSIPCVDYPGRMNASKCGIKELRNIVFEYYDYRDREGRASNVALFTYDGKYIVTVGYEVMAIADRLDEAVESAKSYLKKYVETYAPSYLRSNFIDIATEVLESLEK